MSGRLLLSSVAGLVGWAAAFASVYALHGLACAAAWPQVMLGPASLQRAALLLAWAFWLLLLGLWAWWTRRVRRVSEDAGEHGTRGWLLRLAEASAWSGLAATIVSLGPVATHGLCR